MPDKAFFSIKSDCFNAEQIEDSLSEITAALNLSNNIIEYDKRQLVSVGLSSIIDKCRSHLLGLDSSKVWLQFSKAWLVRTSPGSLFDKVPYVPHIDARRFFKAMIYLSDVTVSDGPIFIADKSPDDYELLRLSLGSDYKENRENVILDPGLNYQPCDGKKGTAVFFDTNSPHYAGAVNPGRERLVLRLDFAPMFMNNVIYKKLRLFGCYS